MTIELSSRVYPGFSVVALAGELDAASAPEAVAAIQASVEPGQRVIVDLEAVQFAAGHALVALAVAAKRARRVGGGVLLAAPQAAVLRVLELTGLAAVFCVHASVAAAARADCGTVPCAAAGPAVPACPLRLPAVKLRPRVMAADAAGRRGCGFQPAQGGTSGPTGRNLRRRSRLSSLPGPDLALLPEQEGAA